MAAFLDICGTHYYKAGLGEGLTKGRRLDRYAGSSNSSTSLKRASCCNCDGIFSNRRERLAALATLNHSISSASPALSLAVTPARSITAARPALIAASPAASSALTVGKCSDPMTRSRSPSHISNEASCRVLPLYLRLPINDLSRGRLCGRLYCRPRAD